MFGRATLTLGIGPHSSWLFISVLSCVKYCSSRPSVCKKVHCPEICSYVVLQFTSVLSDIEVAAGHVCRDCVDFERYRCF